MEYPYFTGKPENQNKSEPVSWPVFRQQNINDPKGYLVEKELIDAVNVAIVLGQPLLLTGEPGTGKTELAYVINAEFGRTQEDLLKFETKSTSTAQDLFYTYDAVSHFHAAQTGKKDINPLDYITYNAFGKAILHANTKEKVNSWLPKKFKHIGPIQSVVLIDEIDKAPRDFPNDLLNEIEGMYFKVPELSNVKISSEQKLRPLIIITSNSEKHLPNAFLRRCVYYHINFPNPNKLKEILKKRVGQHIENNEEFLTDAIEYFSMLRRDDSGIQKKPATAELLGWITALKRISKEKENPMRNNIDKIENSLSALMKNNEDLIEAKNQIKKWQKHKSIS